MKYVFLIFTMIAFGTLAACETGGDNGSVITTDMGGNDSGGGGC